MENEAVNGQVEQKDESLEPVEQKQFDELQDKKERAEQLYIQGLNTYQIAEQLELDRKFVLDWIAQGFWHLKRQVSMSRVVANQGAAVAQLKLENIAQELNAIDGILQSFQANAEPHSLEGIVGLRLKILDQKMKAAEVLRERDMRKVIQQLLNTLMQYAPVKKVLEEHHQEIMRRLENSAKHC